MIVKPFLEVPEDLLPDFWGNVARVNADRDGGEDPHHLPTWLGLQNYPSAYPDLTPEIIRLRPDLAAVAGTLVGITDDMTATIGMVTLGWTDREATPAFNAHGYFPDLILGGMIIWYDNRGNGSAHELLDEAEARLDSRLLTCGLFCSPKRVKKPGTDRTVSLLDLYGQHGFDLATDAGQPFAIAGERAMFRRAVA